MQCNKIMKRYIKSGVRFDPMADGDGMIYTFDSLSKSSQNNAVSNYLDWLDSYEQNISNDEAYELLSTSNCVFYNDGTLYGNIPNPDKIKEEKQKQEYNKSNNILDIFGYDFHEVDNYNYTNNHLYLLDNNNNVISDIKCVKRISNYKIFSLYFDVALPYNTLCIVNTNTETVWECRDVVYVNTGNMRDLYNRIAEWLETNNPE